MLTILLLNFSDRPFFFLFPHSVSSFTCRRDLWRSGPDFSGPQSSSSWWPSLCTWATPESLITSTTGATCWWGCCRGPLLPCSTWVSETNHFQKTRFPPDAFLFIVYDFTRHADILTFHLQSDRSGSKSFWESKHGWVCLRREIEHLMEIPLLVILVSEQERTGDLFFIFI